MLEADALAEALIMVLKENHATTLFDIYSDERRKGFQFFVDPTSTQNKLRVHSNDADTAVQDDWFFGLMNDPSKITPKLLQELAKPYNDDWRTKIRQIASDK